MGLMDTLVAQPPPLREDAGGIIRVGGTRVRLDTVVTAYKNGCSPDDILRKYPSLRLADIHAVIAYYLSHTREVEAYLEERERIAEDARREDEARFPPGDLRARLMARRKAIP